MELFYFFLSHLRLQFSPFISGQLNRSQDKISAVITLNNSNSNISNPTPGIVTLLRKSIVSVNNLDMVGQWSGVVFANNGKDGIGWISIDLNIDDKGHVQGTSTNYNGQQKGTFQGNSLIAPNGQIVITGSNAHDPQNPIKIIAQISTKRDVLSLDFSATNPNQVSFGMGLLVKK